MLNAACKVWLGDIYMIRATLNKTFDPEQRPEWAEFRGGHMVEFGPHVIDPMRLTGKHS